MKLSEISEQAKTLHAAAKQNKHVDDILNGITLEVERRGSENEVTIAALNKMRGAVALSVQRALPDGVKNTVALIYPEFAPEEAIKQALTHLGVEPFLSEINAVLDAAERELIPGPF